MGGMSMEKILEILKDNVVGLICILMVIVFITDLKW